MIIVIVIVIVIGIIHSAVLSLGNVLSGTQTRHRQYGMENFTSDSLICEKRSNKLASYVFFGISMAVACPEGFLLWFCLFFLFVFSQPID